jgi:ribosome-binding factor A
MSRAIRLAELLKAEISNILVAKVNDHRIGFVTITDIVVSEDLSFAKVFFSTFGSEEEKKKSLKGLISCIPFIRGLLAERIKMRIVPNLRFVLDDSIEKASNRIALINQLAKEREDREKREKTPSAE